MEEETASSSNTTSNNNKSTTTTTKHHTVVPNHDFDLKQTEERRRSKKHNNNMFYFDNDYDEQQQYIYDPRLIRTLSNYNTTNATATGTESSSSQQKEGYYEWKEKEEKEENIKQGFATRGEVYIPLTLYTHSSSLEEEEEEVETQHNDNDTNDTTTTTTTNNNNTKTNNSNKKDDDSIQQHDLQIEKIISFFHCSIPHNNKNWNASFGGKSGVKNSNGYATNYIMVKCCNVVPNWVDMGVCAELGSDDASRISIGTKTALTKNTTIKFHVCQSTLYANPSSSSSSTPTTTTRIQKNIALSLSTDTIIIPNKLKGSIIVNCATVPKYSPQQYIFQEPSIGRIVLESIQKPPSYPYKQRKNRLHSPPKIILDWNPSQSMPFHYGNILFPSPSSTLTSLHRYVGFLRKNKRLFSLSYAQDLKFGQSIVLSAGFGGGINRNSQKQQLLRTSIWEKLFYGGMDTSLLWTRKTSKFASISVGVRHDSSFRSGMKKKENDMIPNKTGYGCLAWLFRIQRGEFNLDIPISFVNDNMDMGGKVGGGGGLIGYIIHGLYLGFVSFLVDAAIGDLFGNRGRLTNMISSSSDEQQQDDLRKEEDLLRAHAAKAREDAERQALLMSRQASIKKRAEERKDGLVIVKAIYMIGDGTNGDLDNEKAKQKDGKRSVTFDVTAQLQFWVVDSKLQLPSSSKSQMLGFYDLTMEYLYDNNDNDSYGGGGGFLFSSGSFRRWWQKHWLVDSCFESGDSTNKIPVPLLNVEYKLGGQLYRMIVRDDEPLILPNATAALLGT